MADVILDRASIAKLEDSHDGTTIRDEDGTLVGYFVRAPPYPDWLHKQADELFPEAELDRRSREPGRTLTTAEVLAYLKTL